LWLIDIQNNTKLLENLAVAAFLQDETNEEPLHSGFKQLKSASQK
jgi:hypothetical protein